MLYDAAMARRLGAILLAAIFAMLAGSAYAQQGKDAAGAEDKALEERRKAVDEAYKAAVDRAKVNMPTRTVDPWGSVREPGPSVKKSEPAAVGTKSGQH
jgi:hypothetical protein